MIMGEVNERIKVGAVFDGPRVTLKWFFWGREKHVVRKVEHTRRCQEGETPLLFFTVTEGSNIYEIFLNQKTLEWCLEKCCKRIEMS